MATKSVRTTDLRSATAASIKAILGKQFIKRPVWVGLWLDDAAISKLGLGPSAIATEMAKQVSVGTGIRITPTFKRVRGGVLVGYIPPKIRPR